MDIGPPVTQDDVLAQPTRRRLFALLEELKRPVGTAELAQRLAMHPNGVRVHLERMVEAGLVVRARARQPRGRPRDAWTISEDARPGGRAPTAHVDLGRWLARAIPTSPRRLGELERVGREIGRELAPGDTGDEPREALRATLVSLGFQPRETPHPDGGVTYCLGNCPYRDAVRENQPVVCTLHRGVTLGLLDVLDPDATLTGFVPRDPDTAGCLIELASAPSS